MTSAARRFTAKRFGAYTRPETTQAPVGVTPVLIKRGNPNDLLVNISNSGTTNISLSYRPNVAFGEDFLLIGNGASFVSRVDLDGDLVTYPIYAVSSAAGGSVSIIETVEDISSNPEADNDLQTGA